MLIVAQNQVDSLWLIRDTTRAGEVVISGLATEREAEQIVADVTALAKLDSQPKPKLKRRADILSIDMPRARRFVARLWRDDAGQDLTEYALLTALIALGAITAMKTIATTINNVFTNAAGSLGTATSGN